MSKRTGHYVVSTHWDREWYQSFQGYRFRLVHMIDEVLDTLKRDPAFRYFQMDGQSIPIEDYLEIRPEREAELKEMCAAGRFRAGPWYVLPDEFLVSGESIIRNLQMGIKVASKYGPASRVGFCCDMFGHISQLPQILRGFKIDNAFVWRGVNEQPQRALFRWQSPDGSEIIAYRFSLFYGYCTYAFRVRKSQLPDEKVELDAAVAGLKDLVGIETGRCDTPSFLLFDGGDHLEIEPRTSEILAKTNAELDGVVIEHSHLDGFVEDLREQRDKITHVIKGELREPGLMGDEAWVIPGVASSRVHLKQANARCENELCRWAEPFGVFAEQVGCQYPYRYLEVAWRHLLQNHPHDSICGCSIDQVHKDMEYRFDQSLGISSHLTDDALRHIAGCVEMPELGKQDFAVVVFNPGSEAIDGPVDLTLKFPADTDAIYQEFFAFEPKLGFRLYDPAGKELPYQYVNHRRGRIGFRRPLRKFPANDLRHEVDVTVQLQVPPFGYTTMICRAMKEPTRHLGSMIVDDHTMENEHLRVSVASNGTLAVLDKRTQQEFKGLLTLEDRSDIGDGWYHGVAVNDRIYSSQAATADVALIADGIKKATFAIRVTMSVPACFLFDKMTPSDEFKPLVVTHEVTLRRGSTHIEVKSIVENTIRDHRLRVLMPSGASKATTYLAEQAFDVVERPIALRADNAKYKELEIESKPQQNFTAVFDQQRGIAVVSTGLLETAVRDLPERPIALTLLRAFIKAVMTNGNEGGEIPGKHEFHYRIVPLAGGEPDVTNLCRLAQQLGAGVRSVQVEPLDLANRSNGTALLPPARSFLKVDSPAAIVTAVHHLNAESAITLRLFNPTGKSAAAKISLPGSQGTVQRCDFEGRVVETPKGTAGGCSVNLKPKQIVTLKLGD